MAKRRKGAALRQRDDLPWLVGIGLAGYVFLPPRYGVIVSALVGFAALMLYVSFLMPTYCHYDVGDHGCTVTVRGKLNGCKRHGQLKHDAVWAAFRLRNPGTFLRLTWGGGHHHGWRAGGATSRTTAGRAGGPAAAKNGRQGTYNMVMLLVTMIGSVAGVLALFVK